MSDSDSDVHWLIKLAQEIREGSRPSGFGMPSIDQDLAHQALSILGELIDICGSEIEPAFLEGYALWTLSSWSDRRGRFEGS